MLQNIKIDVEGYLLCKSVLYMSSVCFTRKKTYFISRGINRFIEDIDAGAWGISYLLPMYGKKIRMEKNSKGAVLHKYEVLADGHEIDPVDLSFQCCYLDERYYKLFSSRRKTVRTLILEGVKRHPTRSVQEIVEMFKLAPERLDRPVCFTGNERFRSMAAIGYAHNKEVFCFPWLSQEMTEYYGNNISWCLDALVQENKFIILPQGKL